MQSSTAIAFRALIMLVFLISVPLVAIFGKDLPEVIKGLLDGRLSVQVTEQPKPAGAPVVEAPAPVPPNGQPTTTVNPFAGQAPYRAAPPAPPTNLTPPGEFPNPTTPPVAANGAVPAGNQTPSSGGPAPLAVAPNPGAGGMTTTPPNPQSGWPAQTPMQTPPDPFQNQQDTRPLQQAAPADGLAAGSAASAGDEKFRQAESRLKELGATHYVLETWGAQNEQYRFTCRMAIGQSVGVTQHFEAIKSDPWQAMQDVLRQVEDWQRQSVQ